MFSHPYVAPYCAIGFGSSGQINSGAGGMVFRLRRLIDELLYCQSIIACSIPIAYRELLPITQIPHQTFTSFTQFRLMIRTNQSNHSITRQQ
jgi:hypothetical protein